MHKDFLIIIVLILTAFASFGLGRLSVEGLRVNNADSEIRIGEIDLKTMPASSYSALQEEEGEEAAICYIFRE